MACLGTTPCSRVTGHKVSIRGVNLRGGMELGTSGDAVEVGLFVIDHRLKDVV